MGNTRACKTWNEDEIRIIEDNIGKLKLSSIHKLLPGRSITAIYTQIQKMGISNTKEHVNGITLNQLAKAINIDNSVIRGWIKNGLLKGKRRATLYNQKCTFIKIDNFWRFAKENKQLLNFKNIKRKVLLPEPDWFIKEIEMEVKPLKSKKWWSNEEDIILQDLFLKNLSYAEIAKQMDRNYSAVAHRINRLCLNKKHSKKWTVDDINMLIDLVDKNIDRTTVAEKLNRSYYSVVYKTRELKRLNKWGKIDTKKIWYKENNIGGQINWDLLKVKQ